MKFTMLPRPRALSKCFCNIHSATQPRSLRPDVWLLAASLGVITLGTLKVEPLVFGDPFERLLKANMECSKWNLEGCNLRGASLNPLSQGGPLTNPKPENLIQTHPTLGL